MKRPSNAMLAVGLALFLSACRPGSEVPPSRVDTTARRSVSAGESLGDTPDGSSSVSHLFVSDAGPILRTSGWPAGLWSITPEGDVTKIFGRRWKPLAVSPKGSALGTSTRGSSNRYFLIMSGSRTRLGRLRDVQPCAVWSQSGRSVSFLRGRQTEYAKVGTPSQGAVAVEGSLWRVDPDRSTKPSRVAAGLFPECSEWALGQSAVTYLKRDRSSAEWQLRVGDEEIDALDTDAPSLQGPFNHRTFDWDHSSGNLFFIKGDDIYRFDERVTPVTSDGALSAVEDLAEEIGSNTYFRSLRVSPDGTHVAAGIGGATGVFTVGGSQVLLVEGAFREWSGGEGILVTKIYNGVPSLYFASLLDKESRLLVEGFKVVVASDPAGAWSAHPQRKGADKVIFRDTSGRTTRTISLSFRPHIWAASTGSKLSDSPWP